MPFKEGSMIAGVPMVGMPTSAKELAKTIETSAYVVDTVRAWAIEHSFGIYKVMLAWRFAQADAKIAVALTDDERERRVVRLAKIAKAAWVAAKPLATGNPKARSEVQWAAVARAIAKEIEG